MVLIFYFLENCKKIHFPFDSNNALGMTCHFLDLLFPFPIFFICLILTF